jgi:Amt family ammonium transporter
MMHSFAAMAIIGVIWAAVGYALSFGQNIGQGILGRWIGWDPSNLFLAHAQSSNYPIDGGRHFVPELVYAMFQGKFAIITPALIAGAFAERVRFRGYCVFIAAWMLLVYCPFCHWVWARDGFLHLMGVQDYAGGIVVHISAGVSALVAAIYLGRRRGYPTTAMHPNNLVMTLMGAGLLWVGWFGFNGGSSLNSNAETARALSVTQVAAASAALMWMILEGVHRRKATSLGLCSGILAGLVAITPAAGVVGVRDAMCMGAISSVLCYIAVIAKGNFGYDDSLDVFGIHGVGSIYGVIGLAMFANPQWIVDAPANWTAGHQFSVQCLAAGIGIVYAAVVSLLLVAVVDKTLGFRLDPVRESAGMDHSLHGEHGYGLMNLQ